MFVAFDSALNPASGNQTHFFFEKYGRGTQKSSHT